MAKGNKKQAGVTDIKLLSMKKDVTSYTSPPEAILARGVKIRIKDLDEFDKSELKPYAPA